MSLGDPAGLQPEQHVRRGWPRQGLLSAMLARRGKTFCRSKTWARSGSASCGVRCAADGNTKLFSKQKTNFEPVSSDLRAWRRHSSDNSAWRNWSTRPAVSEQENMEQVSVDYKPVVIVQWKATRFNKMATVMSKFLIHFRGTDRIMNSSRDVASFHLFHFRSALSTFSVIRLRLFRHFLSCL